MRFRTSRLPEAVMLFACLCSVGGGCQQSETGAPPRPRTVAEEFQAALDDAGHVTFRSWNGKALRMDSDTELVFFRNGTAGMLEYGLAGVRYQGTFDLEPDGRISARFDNFPSEWPEMILDHDAESLLLRPIRGEGFVMGGRGGAYIPTDQGSYWPFRRLTGADDKEVLETLDRW